MKTIFTVGQMIEALEHFDKNGFTRKTEAGRVLK